ncbi:MAG: N-acetyl sugar amidotransferase [Colwellia sp.]|nr:N-acetyl sugar amidotransferase [Colwellia sp.]
MDTTDPEITFDDEGICNHCRKYESHFSKLAITDAADDGKLKELVKSIQIAGKGKKYDCIVGLSGGVDSTYVAYLAGKHGLNPLVVHLDNGWNSGLAVRNIRNAVNKLGFDLHTYVIDWEEFKDLQLAYLKASVIDIEALTDHAIVATLHKLAIEHKIKYILSGSNIVTEAILPSAWFHTKMDAENIKDIHRKYGKLPMKTFPLMDMWMKQFCNFVHKIDIVPFLDYGPYIKKEAQKIITEEFGWKDYGGKHYESVFTRFFQGYILPVKFKVDKRIAHLSTLICSDQLEKSAALKELEEPMYDPELLKIDMEFVLKKFDLSESEFQAIMDLPIRRHQDFAMEGSIYKHYPIFKPFRSVINLVKGQ